MFGKLTPEQKAAFQKNFSKGLLTEEKTAHPEPANDSSDDDSDANTTPPVNDRRSEMAAETLKIDAKARSVEIANIRLFSFEELDLNCLSECAVLSFRKNLIHELSPFPLHLANRLEEIDFFDNKIKKLRDFFVSAMVPSSDSAGTFVKQSFSQPFCALTKLDLSYNQIKKIDGLSSLASTLKELYLVENKIKVIEGLDALHNLELLELGGNRIRDIGSGLEKLTSLKSLWLGKNKIVHIGSSLQTLRNLKLLSLQANRILKIEPENFVAGANPLLSELYLSENGIEKIEHIPVNSMELLDLSFNPIKTINEETINAQNMPQLREFWLTDGKVDAWEEVGKLAVFKDTMETVYLERNPIEDDKRYRNKVYLYLPFLVQIDSWPIVNKDDLEADRTIERRNRGGSD